MKKFWQSVFLITLSTAILAGCSGGAVQLDLPSSHPAHPQATESLYRPPPNYFEGRLLGGPPQSGDKMKMQKAPAQGHKMESHSGHGGEAQPMDDHSGSPAENQSGHPHMEHGK